MKKSAKVLVAVALMAVASESGTARMQSDRATRGLEMADFVSAYCSVNHNVGKVGLSVDNGGTMGNFSRSGIDCFTGEELLNGEYPLGSNTMYMWGGALWIGAIVGTDTLVSTGADGWSRIGAELHPDFLENGGAMIYRSTVDPESPTYQGALSEQDFIGVYMDTCRTCSGLSNDFLDNRGHLPLNIEVTQRSFAWSYPMAEDFVLVEYSIKNIGSRSLENMYIGLYLDQDIQDRAESGGEGALDDVVGMWSGTHAVSSRSGCEAPVEIEMPWCADNDGDLNQPGDIYQAVPHVAGVRLLNLAGSTPQTTFNWWVSNLGWNLDWGPMRRVNARDFTTGGIGTPEGDRNKYFYLSNGDQDYDLVKVGTIGALDSIWLPPTNVHWDIETGMDARYLVSSGGFSLEPGESTSLTVAFVYGENLHTSGENYAHLPNDPDTYLAGLDFSDFLNNGLWAGWVYDNPGVDTDSDGYAGEFQLCGDDTLWYRGDGLPDWCAATRPVNPRIWIEPRDHALYVRWNGARCENQVDWASREKRFEGYRVHLSSTGAAGSFACVGSYDVEDYYRYYWDSSLSAWIRSAIRLTLDESRCRYAPSGCADPTWHPLDYTRQAPYVMPGFADSLLYFLPVMANACQFGLETPFLRRFPDAIRPSYAIPQLVPRDSIDFYLTEDGFFKYYEYEMLIEDLLPGQTYWVAVTSLDYGSMIPGAAAAESPVWESALQGQPMGTCCEGIVGNVNCDGEETVSLGDVSSLIDFLFINQTPVCCLAEADINQSGGADPTAEDISLGDVMRLIDYLFITGPSLGLPDCP